MKTLFYIISLIVLLSSCNSKKEETTLLNDTKNTENIYGVLNLKLGITTINDLNDTLLVNNYFKDPFYQLVINENNEINNDIYLSFVQDFLSQKNIKRYFIEKYKYNNVIIDNLELFFLNDTLISINIYTDRQYNYFYKNDKTRFIDIFINKYGNGVGKINKITTSDYSFSKENRIWKNSKITVEYNEVYNDNINDIMYFSLNNYYSGKLSYKLTNSYSTDSLLTDETSKLLIDSYNNKINKEKQEKLENIKSNI